VPLPAGSGNEEYLQAFEEIVEPAVRGFEPDLLLVSCGFDAHADDPIASMELTGHGFRELARRCRGLAPRVAAVLEGGYNVDTLPGFLNFTLEGFAWTTGRPLFGAGFPPGFRATASREANPCTKSIGLRRRRLITHGIPRGG